MAGEHEHEQSLENGSKIQIANCQIQLPCAHYCGRIWCKGIAHQLECRRRCDKLCGNGRHKCRKLCFQPCGPCSQPCDKKLPCGHRIRYRQCHEDVDDYDCINPTCNKRRESCEQLPQTVIPDTVPKPVGSQTGAAQISKNVVRRKKVFVNPNPIICLRTCEFGHICGEFHNAYRRCGPCKQVVIERFGDCGHEFSWTCGAFKHLKVACETRCGRTLGCEHSSNSYCKKKCWEECEPCHHCLKLTVVHELSYLY